MKDAIKDVSQTFNMSRKTLKMDNNQKKVPSPSARYIHNHHVKTHTMPKETSSPVFHPKWVNDYAVREYTSVQADNEEIRKSIKRLSKILRALEQKYLELEKYFFTQCLTM